MSTFVLILILITPGAKLYGDRPTTLTSEFKSAETCEAARKLVFEMPQQPVKVVAAWCVQK